MSSFRFMINWLEHLYYSTDVVFFAKAWISPAQRVVFYFHSGKTLWKRALCQ